MNGAVTGSRPSGAASRVTAPVKALLLDADGVVQRPAKGWISAWKAVGGADFLDEIWRCETEALTGLADLKASVTELLEERGVDVTFNDLVELWCQIDVDYHMLDLVDGVRAQGLLTALATNQQPYRGNWMLENLPYDEHFDAQFHSFRMGLAKPDPAYFVHIVEQFGIEPDEAVFVDDMPANVAGARTAGLKAVHFSPVDTYGDLRLRLRELSVPGI